MRVLTIEEIRSVEKLANETGFSYMQLMENAGSYCARIIRKTFENTNKRNALVVCGKGKNGGDGFVIARKLFENGYKVNVLMAMGLPTDAESSEMLSRIRAMGINIPIIPGIKPMHRLSQLNILPKTFHVDLPVELVAAMQQCKDDVAAAQVGREWAIAQCRELMAKGVPSIHFYSVGAVNSIKQVAKAIY